MFAPHCQSLHDIRARLRGNPYQLTGFVSEFEENRATFSVLRRRARVKTEAESKKPSRDSTQEGESTANPREEVWSAVREECRSGRLAQRCLGSVALGDKRGAARPACPWHHGCVLGCGFCD